MYKPLYNSIRIRAFFICATLFFCCHVPSFSHAAKIIRIAVIITDDSGPYNKALSGFYEGLKSENINYRSTEFILSRQKKDKIIADVKLLKPDLIHTIGTSATKIAKAEIIDEPIVFSMALNPVASGLVGSMESSGNNLAGASLDVPHEFQFKSIKKKLPLIKRIGVLYSEAQTGAVVADAGMAAKSLGLELVQGRIESPADVPRELNKLIGKVDILWSVADSRVFTKETMKEILIATLRNKVPFVGPGPSFVRSGALFAFEPDEIEIGRQAAIIAKRVLAGEKPSRIPVTVPKKVKLLTNDEIIDVLGIEQMPD